jgi:O-antigen/teichoic acid export membrane protein
MISFNQLRHSRAARNAGASYLAFASTSICGLVSIPIAVDYLTKVEMGLWSIIYVIVGYLLWLDCGVGNATGRKIADAVAEHNQTEINRWWTLSIGVLCLLGLLMILVALGISPFLSLWLFLASAIVSALGMPFRAYPGLLIAQERFHWVPLVQAFIPWIQLGIFWYLLHKGYGVRSYVPALMISQVCGWAIFVWQAHRRDFHVKLDFSGWTQSRFYNLFSYSGSLAIMGISGAVIQSLPSLLLARLGGLQLIPIFNLSHRGPSMLSALASRSAQSFYPNLQRLYVAGDFSRFRGKYQEINQLCIWFSLIAAGVVLAGNRTLVCWLAKEDFFAGIWTNMWFACALLTTPFISGIGDLLQYAGKMGKSGIYSLLEIPLGAVLCWVGYHWFNLPGLAAAFAILPLLLRAPYYLIAGPSYCGFKSWDLCGRAVLSFILVMLAVISAGLWISGHGQNPIEFEFLGRMTSLPTYREVMSGVIFCLVGCYLAYRSLGRIQMI